MPYENVEEGGIRFVFKYDEDAPELLHIFARHLTSIEDAVDTFFDGTRVSWNARYSRFETYSDTHGLFWFWIDEERVVMVVSCFQLDE